MKRLALLTMALVFVTLTPARAADGGAKGFTWYKHCNTTVILYMHTRAATFSDWMNSRLQVATCRGRHGVRRIDLGYLKLWRKRDGRIAQLDVLSSRSAWLKGSDYNPLWEGHDVDCDTPPGSAIRVGDTVWVEAQYRIRWQNGTKTALRDDNSRNWRIDSHSDCT